MSTGGIIVGASFTILTGMVQPVHAGTADVWTGGTSTGFFTATNWVGGVAPTSTYDAVFGSTITTNQPTVNEGSQTIAGLTFQSSTGGWTLGDVGSDVLDIASADGINDLAQTSGTTTIQASIAINANQVWSVGTGGTLDMNAALAGSLGTTLTFGTATTGTGTIVLNHANTFTGSGGFNFVAGTVQLGTGATLSSSLTQPVTGSAGILDLNGVSVGIGALSGSSTITNSNTSTQAVLTLGNNNTGGSSNSILSGNLMVTHVGTGTQQINGTNTYTGGNNISAGVLRTSTGFGSGPILLGTNAELLPTAAAAYITASSITVNGTGDLFQNNISATYGHDIGSSFLGSGYLTVQGSALNFSGDLTGYDGTLDLESNNGGLNKNTFQLNNTTAIGLPNATVVLGQGFASSYGDTLEWFAPTGTSAVIPVGALISNNTSSGLVNYVENFTNNSTGTFQIGGLNSSTTYNGLIVNGTATGITALTKVGTGSLTLTGVNTYTGATNISAGTLALSAAGALTKTSSISIAGGATFDVSGTTSLYTLAQNLAATGSGTATVNGSINASTYTINLQDGSNIGVLAFNNNLTLKTDTLKFDLGSTATSVDEITVGGALSVTGTSTINIAALTSDTSLTPGDYTLITATSGLGSGFSLSPSSLTVGGTNYTFSLTDSTATQEVLTVGGVVASNGSDTWSATGSGNWETASNWASGIVPNGAAQVATFANSIGSTAATVTLTANETVGTVAFSDAAGSYSLNASGASVLTLNNNTSAAAITVAIGNQTINAPIALTNGVSVTTATGSGLTLGGAVTGTGAFTTTTGSTVTVSPTATIGVPLLVSGSLTFAQASSGSTVLVRTIPSLSITSGNVTVATANSLATRQLISVGSLSISGSSGAWSGKLDLADNDLDVKNGSLADLTNQVAEGSHNGAWNGNGITSLSAAADTTHLTALGVIQDSTDGTTTGSVLYSKFDTATGLTATDVLVKYTYYGDANLDGTVDASDYSRIDSGFVTPGATGWFNGDFNGDGVIDGSDYTLIDNAFNTQGNAIASATVSPLATSTAQISGSSAVPEPTTLGLFGIAAAGLLGRRRRH